jgi:hypothetical protein
MIARHISRIAILDVSRSVRKAIPNRFPLSILVPSTLNLISRSRYTPQKTTWKRDSIRRRRHKVTLIFLLIFIVSLA